MNDDKREKTKFPKDFFNISRPSISMEEALEDVIPIEWEQESGDILVHSVKEKDYGKAKKDLA